MPCRDDAALAGLGSMEGARAEVGGGTIVGAPVPQIWEPIVEGVQLAPQERVQNRIPGPDRGYTCTSDSGGCRGSWA